MLYNSPQLSDAILKTMGAKRYGPAVTDLSGLVAAYDAEGYRRMVANEQAGRSYGLARQRLAEDARQFNARAKLAEKGNEYARSQGNIAAALSAAGLGVGILDYSARQRRQETQLKLIDENIAKLRKAGDERSAIIADMLQALRPTGY